MMRRGMVRYAASGYSPTKVSPRSRHYSTRALDTLADITARYPVCPDAAAMKAEDGAWLNESIRRFYECVKATHYTGFGFRDMARRIRNLIAHNTGEEMVENIQTRWKAFYDITPGAKDELEANIRRADSQREIVREIEKHGNDAMGNAAERKRKSDALSDVLDDSVPQAEKVRFGNAQSDVELQKFLTPPSKEDEALLEYAKGKGELAEQIKEEMLECLNSAYEDTDKDNPQCPYFEENVAIKGIQRMEDTALMSTLEDVQKTLAATATGKDNTAKFDYYKGKANELFRTDDGKENTGEKEKKTQQGKGKSQVKHKEQEERKGGGKDVLHEAEVLSRNLKREIKHSFDERYIAWQLKEIDEKRKSFLADLYKRIERFRHLEQLLSPFTRHFGRLWDLSQGALDDSGFEVLEEFADLLERDEGLRYLADLMGRQSAENAAYKKELRDKTVITASWKPHHAYRGQISGLRLSGDITSALPVELSLAADDETWPYFARKLAEKQLLSYAYENRERFDTPMHKMEDVNAAIADKKGPVIICVDTSGSMTGTPEYVAKTLAFAVASKCIDDERNCYLTLFSSANEIKSEDLSAMKGGGLGALVSFLRMSFGGGTDASGALQHSLKMLETSGYHNSDVLMISDFVMPSIDDALSQRIAKQKEQKTRFFSLVIGSSGNQNALGCFNENWGYDTGATGQMRRVVHSMTDAALC